MEGKAFVVANLFEEVDEEESTVNKVDVQKIRHTIKKTPFCISVNIMDNISHCCLIDDVTKGKLLEHIVSDSGISIDPESIVAILNLPPPTSKKEVQAFMGVINFVCRFVPDFSVMFKPIHNLLKQYHSFSWSNDVENSFVGIKKVISFAPVLVKLHFEKEFMIYTNATEEAVSIILLQCDDQGNEI
jgi:hypothetical protein